MMKGAAPSGPPRSPASAQDLKAGRIFRIVTVIVVAALFCLYFALNPAGSGSTSSGSSSTAKSSSSTAASENGTRAVGNVEAVTVYHVIDGDTLYVHRANGSNAKVRLVGMNCPESVAEDASRNTEEGIEASDHTKSLVAEEQTVWLSKDTSDTDQYGRLLRYVWLEQPSAYPGDDEIETKMLDAILVEDGYAQAKRYEPDTAYISLFERLGKEAIEEGRGVSASWA